MSHMILLINLYFIDEYRAGGGRRKAKVVVFIVNSMPNHTSQNYS